MAQKVHSNEQMRASVESGGRSLSQHSQFGLSFIMDGLLRGLSAAEPRVPPAQPVDRGEAQHDHPGLSDDLREEEIEIAEGELQEQSFPIALDHNPTLLSEHIPGI